MPAPIYIDGRPIDYAPLPQHLRAGMRRYLELGVPPGSFLRAVLRNDLSAAVLTCSDVTMLRGIMIWLHNYTPRTAHGSTEAFDSYTPKEG